MRRRGLALVLVLLALSCTRMPTAPRRDVVLEGTLTAPDGAPVRYVHVFLWPQDPTLPTSEDPLAAMTDAAGHYEITLTAGTYLLRIPSVRRGWIGYSNKISVSPDHRTFDFHFHGVAVSGRLFDPDGVPIDGGVQATTETPYPSTGYTYTEDGIFTFLLPPGTYSFQIDGFRSYDAVATTVIRGVSVAGDTALDLHFVGVPVQGVVLGMDGLPLQSALVDAYPTSTYTDDSGHYRLYTPAGVHAFRCFAPQREILPRLVTLALTGPTTLDFDMQGHLLWSGRLVDGGNGQPLPGCYVVADVYGADNRDAYSRTDVDGAFHLYLEPKLSYDLRAYASSDWHRAPIYSGVFRANADTTFELPATPAPVP